MIVRRCATTRRAPRRSVEATGWEALGSQPNVLNQLYHYGDRAASHHEPNEALAG